MIDVLQELKKANETLQNELLAKEDKVDELRDILYNAKRYIKENSAKLGKFTIMIDENEELLNILSEKVQI